VFLAPGLLRRGYIESWNLTFERKLAWDLVGALGYVGTHTVRELGGLNINAGSPGLGTAGEPLFAKFGRIATTTLLEPAFGANYNSLQARLDRRFSNGLMLKGSYTYSHAIDFTDDDAGGFTFHSLSQLGRNRALAGFDRTHILTVSGIYEFPFGPGKRWLNQKGPLAAVARS
jgi:hypothetical protein